MRESSPGVRGRRSTQHMQRERALVHPRSATYRLLPGTNKCVRHRKGEMQNPRAAHAPWTANPPRCVAPARFAAATTRTPEREIELTPASCKNLSKDDVLSHAAASASEFAAFPTKKQHAPATYFRAIYAIFASKATLPLSSLKNMQSVCGFWASLMFCCDILTVNTAYFERRKTSKDYRTKVSFLPLCFFLDNGMRRCPNCAFPLECD